MNILHTADWHLGARLHRQSREAEQAQFLNDLLATLTAQRVDILLIAGDVFDTAHPSLAAQELYYRFLARLLDTPCQQTVIIAGNHDSPYFLSLPQPLLRPLNIHIIAEAQTEALPLYGRDGQLLAVLAAAPYLRERDLRRIPLGESQAEAEAALLQAIDAHYQSLTADALAKRGTAQVPIIGMGHLFSSGAQISEDEAIRDLYVGKLGHVPASIFSPDLDYVALGHIHRPQRLTAATEVHYSGSPIPLSFGEAATAKRLLLLRCQGRKVAVEALPLPSYQSLRRLESASLADLERQMMEYADEGAWLEVHFQGEAPADLYERLQSLLQGKTSKLLRLVLPKMQDALLTLADAPSLQELQPEEVFNILLREKQISAAKSDALRQSFREILQELQQKTE